MGLSGQGVCHGPSAGSRLDVALAPTAEQYALGDSSRLQALQMIWALTAVL